MHNAQRGNEENEQATVNHAMKIFTGEVVLHASTWSHCNHSMYRASVRDETFRVVTQIYSFINPEKRGTKRQPIDFASIAYHTVSYFLIWVR